MIAAVVVADCGVPQADAGMARAQPQDGYYLSTPEVAAIRVHLKTDTWVRVAWLNTKAFADARLGGGANPPDPNGDYSLNWRDALYLPGLAQGLNVEILALAYRISGDRRYADAARDILMGWVRVYAHPPGYGGGVAPGHMVAEPVGPMIKLFIAADLLRPYLTLQDRMLVSAWARQWITVGKQLADSARDSPWVPDSTVGSFVSNEASYGNSAMGQRALAVWAAAVAGPHDLQIALDWNWSHTTKGGSLYGWDDVIEKLFITGGGGETIEGRDRQSVGYGLFAWSELLLIADVAKHAGYPHDLFTTRTRSGKSLLSAAGFYAPLLTGKKPYPYAAAHETFGNGDYVTQRSEFRAVFETAYANCPKKNPACSRLQSIVRAGGPTVRGSNFDNHETGWNALRNPRP